MSSNRFAFDSKNVYRHPASILDVLRERNMTKVDVVDADVLLSDFLRRVANDKHADDQIVQKSVMNIVGGLAQNTKLQHALVT